MMASLISAGSKQRTSGRENGWSGNTWVGSPWFMETKLQAFLSADEAILEAFRRFGTDQVMLKEIRDPDPPDFIPLANPEHPSFQNVS